MSHGGVTGKEGTCVCGRAGANPLNESIWDRNFLTFDSWKRETQLRFGVKILELKYLYDFGVKIPV